MKNGIFGKAFDLNGDGKVDSLERAFETAFVMDMIDSCEKENTSYPSSGSRSSDDLNFVDIEESVEDVGLDSFELADCLEEAGLDPLDF